MASAQEHGSWTTLFLSATRALREGVWLADDDEAAEEGQMTSRDATELVDEARRQVLRVLEERGAGASLDDLVFVIQGQEPSITTATVKAAVMSLVAMGQVEVTPTGDADLVPA